MTVNIERRRLIIGGTLGLGALLLPQGRSLAAEILAAKGFTHSVASGEPAADSMLLWTRYVPAVGDEATVEVQVALDKNFRRVVSGRSAQTGAYRDWTVKVTVDDLEPGTVYWYRFVAPDGSFSPVGRTKTLPVGKVERFGLGLFSCSNLPVGWFNAYAHAALRGDMDMWLHVGDYIYEYGVKPDNPDIPAGRNLYPAHDHEMISLLDYRLRFACYRADPDLQELHRIAPMVALWDDHESTNDSYEYGAQNHQPGKEGDWSVRKAAAMQAYREWMPVSEEPWKAYPIGELATLYRTESRLTGRTRPLDDKLTEAFREGTDAAIEAFRDGPWQDPSNTMLGFEQEAWLAREFTRNAKWGAWQIVGMATILGRTYLPQNAMELLRANASKAKASRYASAVRAARLGQPLWMDRWDGYPAARSRLLRSALHADAELVMLSGDSHNAWAYSLREGKEAVGVEFAGHSVTSGGMEGGTGADPKLVAKAFVDASPELVWANTYQRGYMMIDITPKEVSGEWVFMRDVKTRHTALAGMHRMSVERGRRSFAG